MKVEVRLFAYFRDGRQKIQMIDVEDGSPVVKILDILSITPQEVSILLINGFDGGFERILKEGDIIAIFPPVGGG